MEKCLYIAHHGIKGQKWGIRRYQNPDGTLTPLGEKRYYKKGVKAVLGDKEYMSAYSKSERRDIKRIAKKSKNVDEFTDRTWKKYGDHISGQVFARGEDAAYDEKERVLDLNKNLRYRAKQGGKIGAALGAGAGTAVAAYGAATLLPYVGIPSMATYGAYAIASTAISGWARGTIYGSIYGAVETAIGERAMSRK